MSFESNLNTSLTVVEGLFNFVGYLPRSNATKGIAIAREFCGVCLFLASATVAITNFAIAFFKKDSAEACKDIATKSLFYVGQGALNFIRGRVERAGGGAFTLAYDLMGQKLLPYTQIKAGFDIQSRAFSWIKMQLDKVNISEIIPSFIKKMTT